MRLTSLIKNIKDFFESVKEHVPYLAPQVPPEDNQAIEEVCAMIDKLEGAPDLAASLKNMLQSDHSIGELTEGKTSEAIDALYRVGHSFPVASIALSTISCRPWIPTPRTKQKT